MKDIPLFTSRYGAASLTLREIPYTKTAYFRIQATEEPENLIRECRNFCKACGAENIFATGHAALNVYPFYTSVVKMQGRRMSLPETDAALWPVLPENLEEWRAIYNRRMNGVPNAAWMTKADGEKMLSRGDGYFVHRERDILGIGQAKGGEIRTVISCRPGAGREVVAALCHVLSEESVVLEVASTNKKAVRLYEKLGFLATEELSAWYCLTA